MQHELFDAPRVSQVTPAGFDYQPDAVGLEQEKSLITRIDALPLSPFRFQGWTGKRLTYSFGWSYDFETARAATAPPMPDWLLPVRAAVADFTALDENELIQALLIRYDPGTGIGWHRDRPIFEHVAGLSLGAQATLRLRRRTNGGFERRSISVAPRSLYHLQGEARHSWEHSIAPMDVARWSITFRSLSENGRRVIG